MLFGQVFKINILFFIKIYIYIFSDLFSQLERLKLRNHYDDKEAKNRIESQMNLDKKKEVSYLLKKSISYDKFS